MPIVTGYEDTPGGHDALVLGAQLTRLTGLGAIVATVYPSDGRGWPAPPRARMPTGCPGRAGSRSAGSCAPASSSARAGATRSRSSSRSGRARWRRVLTDFADEVGAAVLVVGSTGHGLLGRIAPGRTVQRLLPTSRCPVAIAPRGYRHTAGAGILSVAVAYDGSPAPTAPWRRPCTSPAARGRCCGSSRSAPTHGRRARRPGARAQGRGLGPAGDRRARRRGGRAGGAACWPTCRSAPTCW